MEASRWARNCSPGCQPSCCAIRSNRAITLSTSSGALPEREATRRYIAASSRNAAHSPCPSPLVRTHFFVKTVEASTSLYRLFSYLGVYICAGFATMRAALILHPHEEPPLPRGLSTPAHNMPRRTRSARVCGSDASPSSCTQDAVCARLVTATDARWMSLGSPMTRRYPRSRTATERPPT